MIILLLLSYKYGLIHTIMITVKLNIGLKDSRRSDYRLKSVSKLREFGIAYNCEKYTRRDVDSAHTSVSQVRDRNG